jgi:hypothetical protein
VPLVAALAFQNQGVLSELVTEFLDLQVARHDAIVAAPRLPRPSSTRDPGELYVAWLAARALIEAKLRLTRFHRVLMIVDTCKVVTCHQAISRR